jgi:hypothetical protein
MLLNDELLFYVHLSFLLLHIFKKNHISKVFMVSAVDT